MILLNEKEVQFGNFPNNETYLPVKDLLIKRDNLVKLVYENDQDFLKLALVKEWCDSMGCETSLYLTYMPHSRMDRANGFYSISLNASSRLINSLNFKNVIVREPHSSATIEKLNNSIQDNWCLDRLKTIFFDGNFDSVYFPDYGACLRYSINGMHDIPLAWAKKTRDFLTGEITGLEITGKVGKNVLIVDDLCSRGGTFIQGSKLLKLNGAENVSLLVSYVEDNVFTGEIFKYINKIYTSSERELKNHSQIIKIK